MSVKRSTGTKAGGGVNIGETKTGAGVRTITMPPSVATLLQEKQADAISEWVFPHYTNPSDPLHPSSAYKELKPILKNTELPLMRFHDLRHTFATMALENGMDVKTLSDMIGHISAETTLNIYPHITDTMRAQASVKIDRKIGGTDAQVPEAKEEPRQVQTSNVDENFEPYRPKIRKSGTGCVYQINDSLWEGSFDPRLADGKRKKFNIYAKTREECEEALAKMIAEKKAEIAAEKAKMKTA